MATRNGSAEWKGDLKGGSGTVKVGDGVFEGNYSFSSRFEDGEGTNPEELIGAAHAGCFAMALSLILTEADHPPESIKAEARVYLRIVDSLPTIAKIDLDVEGDRVRLQPANTTMDPIYTPAENVEIQGRLVGVVRSYA